MGDWEHAERADMEQRIAELEEKLASLKVENETLLKAHDTQLANYRKVKAENKRLREAIKCARCGNDSEFVYLAEVE